MKDRFWSSNAATKNSSQGGAFCAACSKIRTSSLRRAWETSWSDSRRARRTGLGLEKRPRETRKEETCSRACLHSAELEGDSSSPRRKAW